MAGRTWVWWAVAVWMGVGRCWGHGRLLDPPSRASAWRFDWGTPVDYEDNEGFCGGFTHQYQTQGGRCGVCGDAWDEDPRPHEAGGSYATGTIVRQYTEGQVIPVTVEITANHQGHFEFRICPNNNPSVEASQTCLNQHPVPLADGSGFYYPVPSHRGEHLVQLQLPPGITCTQCVFQWRYVAANNWGICEDGTGRVGCGPQEEFRACADVGVSALPSRTSDGFTGGTVNETAASSEGVTSSYSFILNPTENPPPPPPITTQTTRAPSPMMPSPSPSTTSGSCRAVGIWQQVPDMDQWCIMNCLHTPPYCPATHCTCD